MTSANRIAPKALADLINAGGELAVLDVREEGVYSKSHLFYAASIPLSRLELRVRREVPRLDTSIVLVADDPQDVETAATRLRKGGYTKISALDGGNAAWKAAGLRLFSGVFVPSKAFGELVEHANDTPRLKPKDAEAVMRSGESRLYVDSRPMSEFRNMSLPGAYDCPGAELVLRAPAAAKDRPILVNCAGRTRSIIGAQSLINAGIPNKVYALENGTMGWHLNGFELRHGVEELLPMPAQEDIATARQRARVLAEKLGVHFIDKAALATLRADTMRTTYCFDVRLPEDYSAGHLPGFVSAPGGQLVQATDVFAPVRNARMVLFDVHGVQAPMTGHWLRQMGWEVHVLEAAFNSTALEAGNPLELLYAADKTTAVDGIELAALMHHSQTLLIDVDDSRAYRRTHLRGARFLTRSRVPELARGEFAGRTIVFTSRDGLLAQYAAADAAALGLRAAHVKGGTAAAAATLGLSGEPEFLCDTDDAWYKPYELAASLAEQEQAMRDYITWETGLIDQLDNEPGMSFQVHLARQA